jgi:hypothetical protein
MAGNAISGRTRAGNEQSEQSEIKLCDQSGNELAQAINAISGRTRSGRRSRGRSRSRAARSSRRAAFERDDPSDADSVESTPPWGTDAMIDYNFDALTATIDDTVDELAANDAADEAITPFRDPRR